MDGLQRSATSFRRQGSSGIVWDDKFLSGELNSKQEQEDDEKGKKKAVELRRSKSDGRRVYRAVKVEQAEEPPSPRVRGCGFCGVFGKSPVKKGDHHTKSSGKRKP